MKDVLVYNECIDDPLFASILSKRYLKTKSSYIEICHDSDIAMRGREVRKADPEEIQEINKPENE